MRSRPGFVAAAVRFNSERMRHGQRSADGGSIRAYERAGRSDKGRRFAARWKEQAMRRRTMHRVIAATAMGLLVTARAQERVYRIGYLSWQNEGTYYDATLRGFLDGLRSEGFIEGKNLELLRRSASN